MPGWYCAKCKTLNPIGEDYNADDLTKNLCLFCGTPESGPVVDSKSSWMSQILQYFKDRQQLSYMRKEGKDWSGRTAHRKLDLKLSDRIREIHRRFAPFLIYPSVQSAFLGPDDEGVCVVMCFEWIRRIYDKHKISFARGGRFSAYQMQPEWHQGRDQRLKEKITLHTAIQAEITKNAPPVSAMMRVEHALNAQLRASERYASFEFVFINYLNGADIATSISSQLLAQIPKGNGVFLIHLDTREMEGHEERPSSPHTITAALISNHIFFFDPNIGEYMFTFDQACELEALIASLWTSGLYHDSGFRIVGGSMLEAVRRSSD